MKRRLICFLILVSLCLCAAFPVLAAEEAHPPRLVDGANLLEDWEETELLDLLDEISQRQQLDVVVVTTDTLGGKSPMAYADDYYDYNGYGFGTSYDGVLLLVSMEDRDWWISTCGYGITVFSDAGISYISEQFLWDLGEGYYVDAFTVFAQQCDAFITQARTGDPYDTHNLPKEPFDFGFTLVIALVMGAVAALIVVAVLKGQLKSVRRQQAAADYVVRGSMQVTNAYELFLYRNINRVKRQTDSGSSTHRSSSGRSHGGGGGKF